MSTVRGLSDEQRWLLFGIGGHHILGCIRDAKWGVSDLFGTQLCRSWLDDEVLTVFPEWRGLGMSTSAKAIHLGMFGHADYGVSVSRGAVARFFRDIPDEVRAAATECAVQKQRHAGRSWRSWHHRGNGHIPLDTRRPQWSKDRLQRGRDAWQRRLAQQQRQVIRDALRVGVPNLDARPIAEPADLLELLAMTA